MEPLKTTLILIPGGEELALPGNTDRLRRAMHIALTYRTARIIMLADAPVMPEKALQRSGSYKNVLLIESDAIHDEDDAWRIALESQAENYLPIVADAGFDFQVIRMEPVAVKYEDFEIIEKYL